MKRRISLIFFFFCIAAANGQTIKVREPVNFLALGDSYTIGQSVGATERWPVQFMLELGRLGYGTGELKIIAQTGWRTDNLQNAINQQLPLNGHNLVSLLIGVNNQYQGGNTQTYAKEFEELLEQAISIAGGSPSHVFVLSIPDYAYTPYGNGNPDISAEIDEFNQINRIIAEEYSVKYIDITPISRKGLAQPELVASDGLHPSGLMYFQWIEEILKSVEKEVGISEKPIIEEKVSYTLLNRQLSLNHTGNNSEMVIYNLNGQKVVSERLTVDSGTMVNLNALADGLYFLLVRDEERVIFTTKIFLD
ncbi:MAG: GDSL-type esterase/lipase family protein [Lentimicrobium sp.]